MLAHTCRLGLEGIISKRKDLPYRPGRGHHWFKAKCMQSQEFVILGYVPSTAASGAVGSLPLGYYADGGLVYAGRVGTGWSAAVATSLRKELDKIKAGKPALRKPLPGGAEKGVVWAAPRLVCVVEYRDWSRDGMIRQASFKGLRDDKPAQDIALETPQKRSKARADVAAAGIKLTHPERILWAEPGITKQGLADFYTDIADWILPHVAGRVLSLLRCPSGTSAKCFFAKHPWAGLTADVQRVAVGTEQPMLAIDDLAGLLDLVQAGVVEVHPWGSRADDLERPDRLIFDLDPGEDVPWGAVISAAREVRAGWRHWAEELRQDTGGKGLHVVSPSPRAPAGTRPRPSPDRSPKRWRGTRPTTLSPPSPSAPGAAASWSTISATTAARRRWRRIRPAVRRSPRYRRRSTGTSFRSDCGPTISRSATSATGSNS